MFDEMMQNMDRPDLNPMICAEFDPTQRLAISFMMACHRIMSGDFGFEEALLSLQPLNELSGQCICSGSFKNSLRAICCARILNWIDFTKHATADNFNKGSIDMHAHKHYSRYVAAAVHAWVYSLLLVFSKEVVILTWQLFSN